MNTTTVKIPGNVHAFLEEQGLYLRPALEGVQTTTRGNRVSVTGTTWQLAIIGNAIDVYADMLQERTYTTAETGGYGAAKLRAIADRFPTKQDARDEEATNSTDEQQEEETNPAPNLPAGTRVRIIGGEFRGSTGTVQERRGTVPDPDNCHHTRSYVLVELDHLQNGSMASSSLIYSDHLKTVEQGDPAPGFPPGTRVRLNSGTYAGNRGIVTEKRGIVTSPTHRNFGRAYVSVELETGTGAITRKFTDELSTIGIRGEVDPTTAPATSDDTPIGTHVEIHSGHYAGSTGTITEYDRGMINFPGSPDDGRVFTGVALSEDDPRNPRQVVRVFHDEMHATGAPVDKDSAPPGTRVRVISGDFKGRTGTVRGHEHRDTKIVTIYMDTERGAGDGKNALVFFNAEVMILPEEEDTFLTQKVREDFTSARVVEGLPDTDAFSAVRDAHGTISANAAMAWWHTRGTHIFGPITRGL